LEKDKRLILGFQAIYEPSKIPRARLNLEHADGG
jgi:hypothetical protein